MHDAITILSMSFSIPKLQYILRTSPAFSSPLLRFWDHLMMAIVSRITKFNFNQDNPSWLQATLPVGSGGHGFRSASSLALSAFLASADGASDLMHQLLPPQLSSVPYHDKDCALSTWKSALPMDAAVPTNMKWQKSWDQPMVQHQLDTLWLAAQIRSLYLACWV